MIINDSDALVRLNSPLNLINQLRKTTSSKKNDAMSLFIPPKKEEISFNPFQERESGRKELEKNDERSETLDNILRDNESQIKLGLAHDNALKLLNDSVSLLSSKLDDVKADKLPSVISAASKTVESIRKERSEANKNNKDREVHYHFYTPQQNKISDYEIIEVSQ